MSTLTIKNGHFAGRQLTLEPGTLSLGRSEENELFVAEPSISSRHCELKVSEIGIAVRDLGSTNGTFINGERVTKGVLQNGDMLRAGEVDFVVQIVEANIAIPLGALQAPEVAGAAFLDDGSQGCFTHRTVPALFSCSRCEIWWCGDCVRQMKRLSGDFLIFCPECSGACVRISENSATQRKSLLRRVTETLRLTPKKD